MRQRQPILRRIACGLVLAAGLATTAATREQDMTEAGQLDSAHSFAEIMQRLRAAL
ncbi:hypothetical protein JMJ56_03005 [Belnapia sp. T18]|uniref:Uncharacterized protein n=1 Tax=Belnapia arida TaxID=2804533 RepID=A0ABS1TWY9_9PROT|nr:hypothetical protein [Belnapia arida]MBL6076958.1 hypothetical protein [Belnapia arida]